LAIHSYVATDRDVVACGKQTYNSNDPVLKGRFPMKACLRSILAVALAALALGTVQAEVTHVEITSRQDVLGGKSFGSVGAY